MYWTFLNGNIFRFLEQQTAAQLAAVVLVLCIVALYCFIHTVTIVWRGNFWRDKGVYSNVWIKTRALIVIAHPDDEAMFFGPTIRNLVRDGHEVYLLCFSYGDSAGLGLKRKAELWRSARRLGIKAENVTIIKHDKLKDGMNVKWPVLPISSHIQSFTHAYDIDIVITFDESGVTGHLNHVGVHYAVLDLIERNLLPKDCQVYALKSVGFFRQYCLGLFNIPPSYYFNRFVYVAIGLDYKRIRNAMECHKSQMVWFRHLHICCSTYMMVNILQKVRHPKPKSVASISWDQRRKYR